MSTNRSVKVSVIAVGVLTALMLSLTLPQLGQVAHAAKRGQVDYQAQINALLTQLDAAATQISALEAKLAYVYVETGTINDLAGPHLIIEGCNVHVRSGSGRTYEFFPPSGLGNLIVGYNTLFAGSRAGSHNLVVGDEHAYSGCGGFVAGYFNSITGRSASVSGGLFNTASGDFSALSGGSDNTASSYASTVSGGVSQVSGVDYGIVP